MGAAFLATFKVFVLIHNQAEAVYLGMKAPRRSLWHLPVFMAAHRLYHLHHALARKGSTALSRSTDTCLNPGVNLPCLWVPLVKMGFSLLQNLSSLKCLMFSSSLYTVFPSLSISPHIRVTLPPPLPSVSAPYALLLHKKKAQYSFHAFPCQSSVFGQ